MTNRRKKEHLDENAVTHGESHPPREGVPTKQMQRSTSNFTDGGRKGPYWGVSFQGKGLEKKGVKKKEVTEPETDKSSRRKPTVERNARKKRGLPLKNSSRKKKRQHP